MTGKSSHYISAANGTEAVPVGDCVHSTAPYLPQSIPEDLAPRLMRFHGHPFVWWVGQFLKYMLRPSDEFRADLEDTKRRMDFINPIVGLVAMDTTTMSLKQND